MTISLSHFFQRLSSSARHATPNSMIASTSLISSQFPGSVRGISTTRAGPSSRRMPRLFAMDASAAGMQQPSSLYEVLGVAPGATTQDIKAAYRRLARACHPDVAAGSHRTSSADEFIKVHAAYSTLSDPHKRADYDRRLVMRNRQQRPAWDTAQCSSSGFSSFPSSRCGQSRWETDQCW